ncbi:UNVERIFIED_CONTAM: hypothetical protein Sangu_0362300 [Sesamum angustifolium]|uniref:Uncharacterized protein n=1 Tax=Sesamum angustifolium TaxID=2727405 RepID=A0AAW2QS73_9LAMI
MSKKMKKIPSIFKSKEANRQSHWQWPLPSCKHPKTLSFRATTTTSDDVFKTVNSVFLDTSIDVLETLETPESWREVVGEAVLRAGGDELHPQGTRNKRQSSTAAVQGERSASPGVGRPVFGLQEIDARDGGEPWIEGVGLLGGAAGVLLGHIDNVVLVCGSCFDSPTSPRSPTGGEMVGDGDEMGIDDAGVVVGQP